MKKIVVVSLALNIVLGTIAGILIYQKSHSASTVIVNKKNVGNDDEIKNAFVEDPTLTFLGNSLIAYADWNELLNRDDVNICGITDFCSHQLTWVLDWAVIGKKPKLCFVAGGQEDVFLNVPIQRVVQNFQTIAATLEQNDVKPVLHTVIPFYGYSAYSDSVRVINAELRKMCLANDIELIDLDPILCDRNGLMKKYTTDGMHLNQSGYTLWANAIQFYLKETK